MASAAVATGFREYRHDLVWKIYREMLFETFDTDGKGGGDAVGGFRGEDGLAVALGDDDAFARDACDASRFD
jgi:hypothetical protein